MLYEDAYVSIMDQAKALKARTGNKCMQKVFVTLKIYQLGNR